MKKKRLLTDKTNGLEDALSEEIGRQIQEEIDWEIICELMKEVGWTMVKTSWSVMSVEDSYYLREWCDTNLTGHRQGRGDTWLFEKEKDATLFLLRWS